MLKIGVVGVGHLGKFHVKNLQQLDSVEFVGFFDIDKERAKQISEDYKAKSFESLDLLLEECDGVSIVVPTYAHFEIAKKALEKGVHIFCEKPFMDKLSEADEIIAFAKSKNLILQVGHIERFNPALESIKDIAINPLFIESHRISKFNPRGIDVAVVLDLMIHDIDIVLSLVKSPIEKIDATGAVVLTDTVDIANARLTFQNGCVANLTASRVSNKMMRKLRIFQRNSYISVDFIKNKSEIYSLSYDDNSSVPSGVPIAELKSEDGQKRIIQYSQYSKKKTNAMLEELRAFANSIINGEPLAVTGEEGKKALEIALHIEDHIKTKNQE